MATKDAKKREAKITANAHAQVARAALPTADAMLARINELWATYGWPLEEKPRALSGGIEKLYRWLRDHEAEITRIRTALRVESVPLAIKQDIQECARRARGGDDPDPSTPLDLARRHGLPLVVVLYIADGEPAIDSAVESPARTGTIYTRPWRNF